MSFDAFVCCAAADEQLAQMIVRSLERSDPDQRRGYKVRQTNSVVTSGLAGLRNGRHSCNYLMEAANFRQRRWLL